MKKNSKDNYQVLARKYRPRGFDELIGQEALVRTLSNAISSGRIAHAFVLTGVRGVGKTTTARIIARALNCVGPDGNGGPTIAPCGECDHCKSIAEDRHVDVIEMDAASRTGIDDIRELIEGVRYKPVSARYKVYIIDEVHMLSRQAFNGLLKTLEEPPKYAVFILATTERHKILPTILSRCQVFNFDRIQVPSIVEYLQKIAKEENIEAEEAALHLIAEKADGAMRDSLSIFDQMASFGADGKVTYQGVIENLNILDYEYYFKITESFLEGNISEALVLYSEVQRKGFDGELFINGMANHFRDLLVAQNAASIELLEKPVEIAGRYQKQALAVSPSFLITAINILSESSSNYRMSRNQRLHVELCLIKLGSLQHAIDVTKKKSLG